MKLGAITIGQAPRQDILAGILCELPRGIDVVECGALDDVTEEELASATSAPGAHPLVTRLRSGRAVLVGEAFIAPRVARLVQRLESEVELVLVLCTGSFPDHGSRVPVLYPERVLANFVRATGAARIGVLTPAEAQRNDQLERWRRIVPEVIVEAASPYEQPGALDAAARRLAAQRIDVVAMDCMGYTIEMKQRVRSVVGRPVLLAQSSLGRVVAELLG